jgi:hypothetical protein
MVYPRGPMLRRFAVFASRVVSASGRRLSLLTLVTLLVCVGLPACPSSDSASAPSSTREVQKAAAVSSAATATAAAPNADSCTVVTQAEAGSALNQVVRPPVRGRATVEGGVACVFYGPSVPEGANPDVPVLNSVRVVLVSGSQGKTFFDDYRTKVPAQAIAGLGDQAYFDGSKSVSVLKGSNYLRVAVIGVVDILGAEERLAAAALPRM